MNRTTNDWLERPTQQQRDERRVDGQRWEDDESRRFVREFGEPERPAGPCPTPRNPRDVAAEYVERISDKLRSGETVDSSDLLYVMVLKRRHGLSLDVAFERRVRELLGWPDKHELSLPAPEPYEEHAMGMHDEA